MRPHGNVRAPPRRGRRRPTRPRSERSRSPRPRRRLNGGRRPELRPAPVPPRRPGRSCRHLEQRAHRLAARRTSVGTPASRPTIWLRRHHGNIGKPQSLTATPDRDPTCAAAPSCPGQRAAGERSERAVEDERVLALIRETHKRNYEAYGYRRLWKALRRAGEQAPRCQIQRLMGEHGIRGAKRRGEPWRTTRRDVAATRRPDLVGRDFTASGPNELWSAISRTCAAGRACCSSPDNICSILASISADGGTVRLTA